MRIFLDIGAWKGDTAQSVLSSKHEFDRIYCFEPQAYLCNDIRALNNPKVIDLEFGLWNKTGKTNLYWQADKKGRKTDGATVYKDKFETETKSTEVMMVKASTWFAENIKPDDYVVMKINCEGSECDIIDDLVDSGEFSKVNALMVDFDVRKIPTLVHRENEIREKLKNYNIPMYFVELSDQQKWRKINGTHYWMDKIL